MRMDALIGGGPDCPAYELVADVNSSLLPVMEKLEIATAAEVNIPSLAQRVRDEVAAAKEQRLLPVNCRGYLAGAQRHEALSPPGGVLR